MTDLQARIDVLRERIDKTADEIAVLEKIQKSEVLDVFAPDAILRLITQGPSDVIIRILCKQRFGQWMVYSSNRVYGPYSWEYITMNYIYRDTFLGLEHAKKWKTIAGEPWEEA